MLAAVCSFYMNITKAITLVDQGVSSTATLLEYIPFKSSGKNPRDHYYYIISYDKYRASIELENSRYPINSTIQVIYDKNNPKLVWLGNHTMNVWDLYCLNTNVGENICMALFLVMGCIGLSRICRKRIELKK